MLAGRGTINLVDGVDQVSIPIPYLRKHSPDVLTDHTKHQHLKSADDQDGNHQRRPTLHRVPEDQLAHENNQGIQKSQECCYKAGE